MARRRRWTTAILVLSLVGLAGCSEDADISAVATFEPSGTGGDGAALEGRLVLTDDCVYVKDVSGRILPIFPNDEVDRGTGEPLTYRGEIYDDGDMISLGGGGGGGPLEGASVPDGCDETLRTFVIAQDD